MTHKSARIAALVEGCQGGGLDARYLGFFECFNRGLFFEAHEVLEDLWLEDRAHANFNYYKGLIQLAGAFVHLQKSRLRPAAALFKLARANLQKYPPLHERLDTVAVLAMIEGWLAQLEGRDFASNPFTGANAPRLTLAGKG